MLAAHGRNPDPVVEITVYTHEEAPLAIFGPAGSAALAEDLAAAGVQVRTGVHVTQSGGHLVAGHEDLRGQRVVVLPRAVGRPPRGLAVDARGFMLADRFGRVMGTEAVWAAGDAVAFPIKQGGLAAQQADVVARGIAARGGADAEIEPFHPVLRGVLLTGRGRAWMRRELVDATDAGRAERHALFWPPTKIAGRYLSPYLAELDEARAAGCDAQPHGAPVRLDLERELPAAAAALHA